MIYSVHSNTRSVYPEQDKVVPWWSFTKTAIATLILRLIEQGEFELDSQFDGQPYTYRQLLQHTSGVADYAMLHDYHKAVASGAEPWSRSEMLARIEVDKLLFPPGKGWRYSNVGYLLLKKEIERRYGGSFNGTLQKHLFLPLGIKNARTIETMHAFDQLNVSNNSYDPRWCYHGLIGGTTRDAVTFLHALMSGQILSKPLLEEMCTPYNLDFDVGDRPWQNPAIGLGLMLNNRKTLNTMGHTGQGPQSCFAAYYFDQEVPVTVAVFEQTHSQALVEKKAVELAKTFK
ncbi:serine hydrolase domain-containing protein [Pseudoalteromonas luteoviolacea]|uniref:Beta-lactamase-related domain-containing protein n=1 Tax=Pseudoalteromonas luteoviolacea S4060-1 TaxID=1365257 RepID=A0A162CGJ0_9GAMM|nr:serine hydrolase domain-containing protein [Pseudoalteromonas luteoviolacea]KZN67570.1 hypothetical protein N478_02105 [Pseudoalteromonas luteoviolacea S4060-1]